MKQRKKEEFFELLEQNYKSLEKYALFITRNREAAKDLIHDTVVDAYDSFNNLKNLEAFLSFIFTICNRKFYKSKSKSKYFIEQEIEELFESEISIEDKTDIELIYKEMEKLDIEERDIITLAYINGLKYKEISIIKNMSIDNIKIKLHRAKKKLISLLKLDVEDKK